jgi:glutathione peroxidase
MFTNVIKIKTMIKLSAVALLLLGCVAQPKESSSQTSPASSSSEPGTEVAKAKTSIYDFKVESLDGGTINFADFKDKKILIVNTASECGYTPQYKDLQALYEKFKDRLVIVGFPANNFGGQEPGTATEIKAFCEKNYGVTFPMAAKVSVKGDDMAPIYKWLTSKSSNGVLDAQIGWNFNKFLIDEKGHLLQYFPSKVKPMDEEIVSKL